MTTEEQQKRIEYLKGQRDHLLKTQSGITQKIAITKRSIGRLEKALEIAKKVGLLTQKQLEYHLSNQVSMAMEAVFENAYELKVNFLERRDKTEVEFLFIRRGMEFSAIGNAGGGAIDAASFALRAAYLCMRQDKKIRPVLVLDEPFSQLKGEQNNLNALCIIREISKMLGIQILMVSDERVSREDIVENADRVFEVRQKKDGVSSISILKGEEKDD